MLLFYILFLSVELMDAGNSAATSTLELERVLEGEDDLLHDLAMLVDVMQEKLRTVQVIVEDAVKRQERAMLDPVAYVSNPLNSLPMIRRMHTDAPKILAFLRHDPAENMQHIADYNLDVVGEDDVVDAVRGLLRIQETYSLDERHMAKGLLMEEQNNAKLSTLDCLTLAQYLSKQGDDSRALKWLQIALEQYEDTPEQVYQLMQTNRTSILKEISEIQSGRENWPAVYAIQEQILEYSSEEKDKLEAQSYLDYVQAHLEHLSICGGKPSPLPVGSLLRCSYNTRSSPFLRLAPLKLEQLSLDPYMVIYHEVIYPQERDYIMQETSPYLSTALATEDILLGQRTMMNAELPAKATIFEQRLRRRIEDMTGYDLSGSQKLTVLNYGLAGQFGIHHDCSFGQQEDAPQPKRIATVMFYLTDVKLGGFTSFPALGLGLQPGKGSALVWHNANNAAQCDKRLLHAACPVLLGNRWVAIQWI